MPQRLGDQRGVEQRQPAAAEGFGNQHSGDTQLCELSPDPPVVGAGLLSQLAHALDGDPVGQKVAHGLRQQPLLDVLNRGRDLGVHVMHHRNSWWA